MPIQNGFVLFDGKMFPKLKAPISEVAMKGEEGIIYLVKYKNGKLDLFAFDSKVLLKYTGDYQNPVIPEGFKYICGEWYNGFVIEGLVTGNQYVWVPVGSLTPNGTLYKNYFVQHFGRRNFYKDKNFTTDTFLIEAYNKISEIDRHIKEEKDADNRHIMLRVRNLLSLVTRDMTNINKTNDFWDNFHEPVEKDLTSQIMSIRKYGGFYVSRFNISYDEKSDRFLSHRGKEILTGVSYEGACIIGKEVGEQDEVSSHLLFASEYDSICQWIIESRGTDIEVVKNSSLLGNYWNNPKGTKKVMPTGSSEDWRINGIYDFAGNTNEWTQEYNKTSEHVIRGGSCTQDGHKCPIAYRHGIKSPMFDYDQTSMRVALTVP